MRVCACVCFVYAQEEMDGSLRRLLSSLFGVGFLALRRITYGGTGGNVLEKIARYETVHKVNVDGGSGEGEG